PPAAPLAEDPCRSCDPADRAPAEPVRGVLHLLHVLAREHEVGIRLWRLRLVLADREHQIAALHGDVVLLIPLQRDHDPSHADSALVELRGAPAGDAGTVDGMVSRRLATLYRRADVTLIQVDDHPR